jgi:uncharacterized repeat protein (TIGR01451 family)
MRRRVLAAIVAVLSGLSFSPYLVGVASATVPPQLQYVDITNHDVASTGGHPYDWANAGALTSTTTVGGTWTRATSGTVTGLFDGGKYRGTTVPPTPPTLSAAAAADSNINDAKFVVDPLSVDQWPCKPPSGTTVTVAGDPTVFTGAGGETNDESIGTFTYGTSGNTPNKDEIENVYAVSRISTSGTATTANEIYFGAERLVNNGDSHIDFEFLQSDVTIPNPCGAGTFSGHRTKDDILLSVDFAKGGGIPTTTLYRWKCNGNSEDPVTHVCDPLASENGNHINNRAAYAVAPSIDPVTSATIASFGVNDLSDITCGGWVCRKADGTSTRTLLADTFMEGGIDLTAAGFHGCISTFLPHTRSSDSFTATLKDFAGPIKFSNCRTPVVTTNLTSSTGGSGTTLTVPTGASVTDQATLTGATANALGTVTYTAFTDSTCTTTATAANGVVGTNPSTATVTNGVAGPSSALTFNSGGTFYWQARYSGDVALGGFNEPAVSPCTDEVLTVQAPSLHVSKTADASPVNAGSQIGFTINVWNDGPGKATSATLSDPLPKGPGINWSINPAYTTPGSCGITGTTSTTQTLGCAFGDLSAGTTATVHVVSPTQFASCATYPNTASASATNAPTTTATASITVQCPNATLSKTADAPSVDAGHPIGFTITYHNSGPGAATGVTLSDPLPSGTGTVWSVDGGTGATSCTVSNGTTQTLGCNWGTVASGTTLTVHVSSPTTATSCGLYPNVATVDATNHAQLTANASTTVNCPGLHISKVADAPVVDAGSPIGFTINVWNTGPGKATTVTLTDALPGGSGINWSTTPSVSGCSIGGSPPTQTLSCNFGTLDVGTTMTVHIQSNTTFASCKTYTNTSTATATNDGTIAAQDSTTVRCPDLHVTKVADATPVNAGSQIGFTIDVVNNGPGTATGVTLSDPLPGGDGISWSTATVTSPGCAVTGAAPNQSVSCNFGDLAGGTTRTVHLVSPTTFDSCGVYPNLATVNATNAPTTTATATITVQCPDLQIVKRADSATVSAGSQIGFTIDVGNHGPGTATGVTLTDPLPVGTGISWTTTTVTSPTCGVTTSGTAQTLGCSFNDVASGTTLTVHVVSATTFDSCKQYPNTASARATNHPVVQASASITVECPSLQIVKRADSATVSAGSQIGFTIDVGNHGPGTATAVSLTDALPTGAGVTWSTATVTDPVCDITTSGSAQTLGCNFGDLGSGTTATVHVVSPTAFDSCGVYNNTAYAQATNHPQVNASASTTVQCPSLHITKVADAASVSAGTPIGFTVKVWNTGPGVATSVTLSDALPSGSGIDWATTPSVSGCDITTSGTAQTLSCDFGDLAPDTTATVHVHSPTTFDSCGKYDNTALAEATNHPQVQASASTTVLCPDLQIVKRADAASVSAGTPIGFSIDVGNHGAGTATAVTLLDPLPAGSGITWSVDSGPSAGTCNVTTGTTQTLSCDYGDIGPGTTVTVHVQSPTTPASCKAYRNTATASATNHESVDASATTTVDCPGLHISKTADATTVTAGSQIGFTIAVWNTGPGTATTVTLADPLPTGSGINWTVDSSDPANACSITSGTLGCDFGDLDVGTTATVHVVSPTTAASCKAYPNTATATAANDGSVDDSATVTVECPSLHITKVADATTVTAGNPIGFTIQVWNTGPGTATTATLSDVLPTGTGISWSIDPAYGGPGSCAITSGTLGCSFGNLGADTTATVHIQSPTTPQSCATYPNTASATATNATTVTASASITVNCPGLRITKAAGATTVTAGNPISFTVAVGSTGPGTATTVTLSDPLPAGSGVTWSIDPAYSGPGTCQITTSGTTQTLGCSFGNMAPGTTATVSVSSPTTGSSCGTYPNTATASAANDGTVQASASITVTCPTTGRILPTQTTCQDFVNGTVTDLTQVQYGVKSNKINNVAPGVLFYFSRVTSPGTTFTVDVEQFKDTVTSQTVHLFGIQQVVVYNSSCTRYANASVTSTAPEDVKINVSGATAGQVFVISVKYSPQTVVGDRAPTPSTVHYSFDTRLNGVIKDNAPLGVDLVKK